MKRKLLAMVCAVSMIASLGAATVYASDDVKATGDEKIALITMDSIDQHWITLNEGAQEEAKDQGIKIVYVDSPANVEAEATFSTDNEAAGTTAGEEMKKALEDAGITSGKIGIINVNAATDSCVNREEGFRAAFDGTDFEIMETQYGEGDAAKSQSIAENYITQGVVGIFGCNEGSTTGAGNAIKAAGNADIIGVGFDKSDAILNLIDDGYLLCTMAQNPDVMGSEGVKAAVKAINGEELGGEVTDTGVSVITKDSDK